MVSSPSELLTEKVATRVVDPSDYALSGVNVSNFTLSRADETLRGIETYAAIERIDPKAYEKMTDEFFVGMKQGKTTSEMRTLIAPIIDKVYMEILPRASSDLLAEYARLLAGQLDFLKQRDAGACYVYANPTKGNIYQVGIKYPLVEEKDRTFRLKVLKMHSPKADVSSNKEHANTALATILDTLKGRYGVSADLLTEEEIPTSKYLAYCTVLSTFYGEIGRLPVRTAGNLMREILASR